MSSPQVRRLYVELLRRGATLLGETCPKCGGLMIRYKGVSFCPNCWGVKSVEEVEERVRPPEDILEDLRRAIFENLKTQITKINSKASPAKLVEKLDVIKKELELLNLLDELKSRRSKQP